MGHHERTSVRHHGKRGPGTICLTKSTRIAAQPNQAANWHAIVTVLHQQNQYVIDDVHIFADLAPDSPSYSVTSELANCSTQATK